MAFRLKYTDSSEFTGMLSNAIKEWSCEEPDMTIVTSDGVRINTNKIILAFYSPLLRRLLTDHVSPLEPVVTVPVQADHFNLLLEILKTGVLEGQHSLQDVSCVSQAARVLGININLNSEQESRDNPNYGQEKDFLVSLNSNRIDAYAIKSDPFRPYQIKFPRAEKPKRVLHHSSPPSLVAMRTVPLVDLDTDTERKHRCGECGRTFKESYHLSRHMLIHTGEKPFGCCFCEKRFNRKDKLKLHTESQHQHLTQMSQIFI